ncbi:circularly permuted type 2 ATP-grasp protein [Aeromicrobium sp.]|uniref:circularly permuted type 2 ATP-grasp protein n=1 Tax=Aeromicrobium sp. TaxID=1871063 RepID=UPI003419C969
MAGFDEMYLGPEGAPAVRDEYGAIHEAFRTMGDDEIRVRADALASSYLDQGVTFGVAGEERPFPLDIVPRVIEAADWRHVDLGVQQRVKALEAFLADVYGPGELFHDGVVPRETVMTSPHYHRVVAGLEPANGVRVHVAGVDLIRDADGHFRVLEDNVRVPSGVSYVMTNRRALSGALPEVFADHRIRPVQQYSRNLLAALRAASPAGVSDPTVVVLTPGVYNSAYFEHTLLARTMGVELVEPRDLVCQGGRVLMRTTRGLEQVHVIYRRIDDDFIDPAQFRPDSVLGVPGLVTASRAGNVTIANAIGNGVADDKLLYTYVPDLIRYYLSEEPILRNVDTWRMGEPEQREEVLDRLDELVLKPVDGSGGKGIVIGPAASAAELDELRAKIHADPRAWIAQPVISLSTVPTLVEQGIRPRHVDLRPFAVNTGDDVHVLPGGLTRVALPEGELIVNSSRGGGSKDTWVLADPLVDPDPLDEVAIEEPEGSRRDKARKEKPRPGTAQVQSQAQSQGAQIQAQASGARATDREVA